MKMKINTTARRKSNITHNMALMLLYHDFEEQRESESEVNPYVFKNSGLSTLWRRNLVEFGTRNLTKRGKRLVKELKGLTS